MENLNSNSNKVYGESIYEKDRPFLQHAICLARAIARTNYQSVYLLDYFRKIFYYVSDNPLFLCGHTSAEVMGMGYRFFLEHIPEAELNKLKEINLKSFEFMTQFPQEDICNCVVTYDFHLKIGNKMQMVNHKLTPIYVSPMGNVELCLCTASLSAHKTAGHAKFHVEGSNIWWNYSFKLHKWIQQEGMGLKEEERTILQLSVQGYTMNQIADIMCKSISNIKACKIKIFDKLNVSSISEAITYAANNKLI